MAPRRARLPLIVLSLAGLVFAAVSVQAADSSSTTSATTSSGSTTQTMQTLQGKNLLWLSSTMTKCPTGYTLTTVQTSSGPKKACVETTNSTSTVQQ